MRYIDSPLMTGDRWRGVRYLLAGGLNTGLGVFMIAFFMYGLSLSPELSNTLSYGIGILTSYLLNRYVTFRSQGNMGSEMIRFFLVYGVAFVANLLILWFMVRQMGLHAFVAQMLAMVVFIATSYGLQSKMVFDHGSNSRR